LIDDLVLQYHNDKNFKNPWLSILSMKDDSVKRLDLDLDEDNGYKMDHITAIGS